ncbi:MAG: amylo-alpha-1,6-glucosidase, partial [Dehalococcoidia bacterium]
LFCGLPRREGEGPTPYSMANSPQSWAAAAVFSLLESCLGLTIHGPQQVIRFSHPVLPKFLPSINIKNLKVGEGSVDLKIDRADINRDDNDALIDVTRKDGPIRIIVNK